MNKLIEAVVDEERKINYGFSYSFGFLRAMENRGLDPQAVWEAVTKGKCSSDVIVKVMQCSLVEMGGQEVSFKSAEAPCIEIIERFGLIEAFALVSGLLTSAMIGDIKKHELSRKDKIQKVVDLLFPGSTSIKFTKAGLQLAGTSLIFGLLGGMISMLFLPFI